MNVNKRKEIIMLSEKSAHQVLKDEKQFISLLNLMSRLYKYSFKSQQYIFAQKPTATACLEYKIWTKQLNRWIRKGTTGISLIYSDNSIKYVYDVSDTGSYEDKPLPLWSVNESNQSMIVKCLKEQNEIFKECNDLDKLITVWTKDVISSYFKSGGKVLGFSNQAIIEKALGFSLNFIVKKRCNLTVTPIPKFEFIDTKEKLYTFGNCLNLLARNVLIDIENIVKNLIIEREEYHNDTEIHRRTNARRKPSEDSRSGSTADANGKGGTVRHDEGTIFNRTRSEHKALSNDTVGIRGTSSVSQRVSAQENPSNGGGNGESRRNHRIPEEHRSNEMGGFDEQLQIPSRRCREDRIDFRIVDNMEIEEAEEKQTSASSISKEDIDSVLQSGSGFENGKYRIYRQFQKYEDSRKNIVFLKNEYGTGGGTHIFPNGTHGCTWHDSKGIAIDRNRISAKNGIVLKWSEIEKRLREMMKDNRYLNLKEKDNYLDYLKKVSAPQYEIDAQRKILRQNFIDSNRDLPPADKRDTLSLRLSDFIRDLDGYEKDLLSNVERTDLADVTVEQMKQRLENPVTVQKLIDFLSLVQVKTCDVYSRSNAWRFSEELKELYPLHYVYQENDVVYIGADKYEVIALTANTVSLRNIEFPLLGQEYSRTDFEEQLKRNPANNHLKVIVTGTQTTETPSKKKPDGIQFSIGFSEHPAFYHKELNDRFTDLTFALGNKLLGVLDEKQHRERQDESNKVGWYHKTDFNISVVIDGEEFNYEGRFDIGDGEGDLLAHIKNFYDYSLSPNCPFIADWKRQGEDYYREQMETLHWGQDVFIPFLMQHTELTPEEEKLLAEIMSFESEWFTPVEPDKSKTKIISRYLSDNEDILIIQVQNGKYFNQYGYDEQSDIAASTAGGFETFEDAEKALYSHRPKAEKVTEREIEDKQLVKPTADKLSGTEISIDNRRYIIESISKISGDVSLRDITFQNNVGFPINRVEKIGYIRNLLEQSQAELPPEEKEETPAKPTTETDAVYPAVKNGLPYDIVIEKIRFDEPERKLSVESPAVLSADRHNFRITDDNLGIGSAKEKFRHNIKAINTLHKIEFENRHATPQEQEILTQYVGWGGLSEAFNENNLSWADEFTELYTALSPNEYAAARESTLTAFYTPPIVVKSIYAALDKMNINKGKILDPACATGMFFGLLPQDSDIELYGVELDSISGRIAQKLYPSAHIAIQGYEESNFHDNYFDLAIGNIPFGRFKVLDGRYDKYNFLIHDYFFAKTLDKVRPGGVIAFITSKGTLDKKSDHVRRYIAQRADLLGAIRLPNNIFKKNAGTEVTSDIIFLQKREYRENVNPDWIHLGENEAGITMNRYFIAHPEMILGEMVEESTQYGMDSTCKPYADSDLKSLLDQAILHLKDPEELVVSGYDKNEIRDKETENSVLPLDAKYRPYSFVLVNGTLYYQDGCAMKPYKESLTAQGRIRGMIKIRDCLRALIDVQLCDGSDEDIQKYQRELNSLYDAFIEKYGLIHDKANEKAFRDDSSYYLLCSLEELDKEKKLKRKAAMFTSRTIRPHIKITKADSVMDALQISIGEKAKVDMNFIQELTGKTSDEIESELSGVIFRVPGSVDQQGMPVFQTADEYLSGNVREKLKQAQIAVETSSIFEQNVTSLKAVQPKEIPASDISLRLGATWLDPKMVEQFMFELLNTPKYVQEKINVHYSPMTAQWNISGKSYDKVNIQASQTYGTNRINAYQIIEDTLNLKDVRIYDYYESADKKRIAVLNEKETQLAQNIQSSIKSSFEEWVWSNPDRRKKLVKIYNETFNNIRYREYDGSKIQFYGMNPEIQLLLHQKNAVARIIFGGNTLLGHVVGAGKSATRS